MRFALAFLPWLVPLAVLAAWLVLDHPVLYHLIGFGVLWLGTTRALARVRADQHARTPDAPADAALLLGGSGWWREMGLAWVEGDAVRFASPRGERRFRRADVLEVRWRPVRRELDVRHREGAAVRRFRFGGLASVVELPRFARAVGRWWEGGGRPSGLAGSA